MLSLKWRPGDRLVQELVDAVDDVGPHQREPAETAAVHHADRQRRTINFLFGEKKGKEIFFTKFR